MIWLDYSYVATYIFKSIMAMKLVDTGCRETQTGKAVLSKSKWA